MTTLKDPPKNILVPIDFSEQSEKAASAADRREAPRIENHAAQVAAEKEKIDEAIAAGSSPLDVLFGVRPDAGRRPPEARP